MRDTLSDQIRDWLTSVPTNKELLLHQPEGKGGQEDAHVDRSVGPGLFFSDDRAFEDRPKHASTSEPICRVQDGHRVKQSIRNDNIDIIDLSQKYARKRRHKTKHDRYEYKDEGHHKMTKKTVHKKDGAKLKRDFKAPNVQTERLTLKQDSMPGIFSKGKASQPVEQRGLPDLAFSEMNFLNKKRKLDTARYRGAQDMAKGGSRAMGDVQEISEYFNHRPDDHQRHQLQRGSDKLRPQGLQRNSTPFSDGDRFQEEDHNVLTTSKNRSHANFERHELSLISWSVSPSMQQPWDELDRQRLNAPPQQEAWTRSIWPRSSISNAEVRPAHTKSLPLDYDHAIPASVNVGYGQASQELYSLEDLKRIAFDLKGKSMDVPETPPVSRASKHHIMEARCFTPKLDGSRCSERAAPLRHAKSITASEWHLSQPRMRVWLEESCAERYTEAETGLLVDDNRADTEGLDAFDHDLLQIGMQRSQQPQAGSNLGLDDLSGLYHGTEAGYEATQACPAIPREPPDLDNDIDTGISQRPQLLRPSQDLIDLSPRFEGFSRPRMLY